MEKLIEKWNELADNAWDAGYDDIAKYGHEKERKYFRTRAQKFLKNFEGSEEDYSSLVRIIENTVSKWN